MARDTENVTTPKEESESHAARSFWGFSRRYRGGSLGEKESTRDREKRRRAIRRAAVAVAAIFAFAAAYVIVSALLKISYFPI